MRRKCCCGKCLFLDWPTGEGFTFAANFSRLSGTWDDSGFNVVETTGSGIALANAESDGAGTDHILMSLRSGSASGDPRAYDIVYDWIDEENYQVAKFRDAGSGMAFHLARVEGGVETDLVTVPDVPSHVNDTGPFYFVRNASNTWVIIRGTSWARTVPAQEQLGGRRFGIRSNSSAAPDTGIRRYWCRNAVDSAVRGLTFGSTTGDIDRPDCLVNPEPLRCQACIHLAPAPGEAQWKITIQGVTGPAASEINGTFFLDPGAAEGRGPCWSEQLVKPVSIGTPGSDDHVRQITLQLYLSHAPSVAPLGVTVGALMWFGFARMHARLSELYDTRVLNCYTDWPQQMQPWENPYFTNSPIPPSVADFSAATCEVDLVY